MLCPDCFRDTLEPEYLTTSNPYIHDAPASADKSSLTCSIPVRFRCIYCSAIYYINGRESVEQAYRRIIRSYSDDRSEKFSPPPG